MKRKTLLCLALAAILLVSCMTGCRGIEDPVPAGTPASTGTPGAQEPGSTQAPRVDPEDPAAATLLSAVVNAKALGFSAFDNQLIEFLKQAGRAEENFTVSPLSFKAALTMAVLGAEGETQAQLLKALGFETPDALRTWYAGVLAGTDDFETYFDNLEKYADPFTAPTGGERPAAYRVVNSVWSNKDLPGAFRPAFQDEIARTCRASANAARAADLAAAVNVWVNEQTKGLIPSILDDASDVSAVLVNALYLKTGWEESFAGIGDGDFTAVTGETVQKPFMTQTNKMRYYKDDRTQLVCVPLQGGVTMVFVLGDDVGLAEKLNQATYKTVAVTVPMFDVETSLDKQELVDYLRLMGCDRMFIDGAAEFDPMYTDPLYVDDIIQKAKVHIDEEGLEAAAVTAITMKNESIAEPETPEVFCADHAFSFYVLKDGETPELLFWGQIVK